MEKKPIEIKHLKENGFVLIDDVPCRVDSLQKSKSGKHGAAKARVVAVGLFDNIKRIIVKPGDARVDVPIIEKKNMQVDSIVGENAQLMDLEDYSMTDVKVPDELKGQLTEGEEVLVWKFGANIMIKGKRG